jgi:hypothetical protein
VNIVVQVEPSGRTPGEVEVEYRWDPDTDILTANCRNKSVGEGMSGSVELAGSDGSWLILDVRSGSINGVEVAVWPDVRKVRALQPPDAAEDARLVVAPRKPPRGVAAIEVDTALTAEADQAERTIHFKVGSHRPQRTVRIARDILIEVDETSAIAGVWLLNVPPFPADA